MEFTYVTSGASTTLPLTFCAQPVIYGGAVTSWPQPSPKPPSPLDWLDAEVERTCALARAVG